MNPPGNGNPITPLLSLRGICKSYAAPVLIDVDFDLHAGQVHALVGANGAGKSTLSRIITGLTAADPGSGAMTLGGSTYAPGGKADAETAGVQMVMQELNLVPTLTVAENIHMGHLPSRLGFLRRRLMHAQASAALAVTGLSDIDPAAAVSTLGVGQQQMVEIAATLRRSCRVLILDEPTAALTDPQIELLFDRIAKLKQQGVGIIYISHRMDEIFRIADRITILRDGRVMAAKAAGELTMNQIIRHMAGRDPVEAVHAGDRIAGDVKLRVEHLSRGPAVRDVSFELRGGEIVGLAGLVGSGRTEMLRAIVGADRPDAGRVYRNDSTRPVKIRQPRDAVRCGIAMIPEDRKQDGLLLSQSVRANTTLATMRDVSTAGWIRGDEERKTSAKFNNIVELRGAGIEQSADELSGGNQQKVVIARWLMRDCEVMLFDEPTRGIDVAAKWTVYRELADLAERGKAVLVVSSDLRELMSICDRMLVMSAGRLAGEFQRGQWTYDDIMAAAFSRYMRQEV